MFPVVWLWQVYLFCGVSLRCSLSLHRSLSIPRNRSFHHCPSSKLDTRLPPLSSSSSTPFCLCTFHLPPIRVSSIVYNVHLYSKSLATHARALSLSIVLLLPCIGRNSESRSLSHAWWEYGAVVVSIRVRPARGRGTPGVVRSICIWSVQLTLGHDCRVALTFDTAHACVGEPHVDALSASVSLAWILESVAVLQSTLGFGTYVVWRVSPPLPSGTTPDRQSPSP